MISLCSGQPMPGPISGLFSPSLDHFIFDALAFSSCLTDGWFASATVTLGETSTVEKSRGPFDSE